MSLHVVRCEAVNFNAGPEELPTRTASPSARAQPPQQPGEPPRSAAHPGERPAAEGGKGARNRAAQLGPSYWIYDF